MRKTMSWSNIQEHVDDSVAFHDMTICELVTIFNVEEYFNDKYVMSIEVDRDLITLSFK